MLVDFALKYNYVSLLIVDIKAPMLGYPSQSIWVIEGNMGRIIAIVPLAKALLTDPPLRHHHQQPAGFQAALPYVDYRSRLADMLNHFGTGNKVILLFQQLRLSGKIIIVVHAVMAAVCQYSR